MAVKLFLDNILLLESTVSKDFQIGIKMNGEQYKIAVTSSDFKKSAKATKDC